MRCNFIKHVLQRNFVFQKKSRNAKTSPTVSCTHLHMLPVAEIETLEVPPFSPSSKEVLSQAVQASFAGFSQERSKHHFPHGRTRTTHSPNTVDLRSAGWRCKYAVPCASLRSDPRLWSEWEVNYWLDWCQREFGLHCLGSRLEGLDGAQLFGLSREAFQGRIPDCAAQEILWEHLEDMRGGHHPTNPS